MQIKRLESYTFDPLIPLGSRYNISIHSTNYGKQVDEDY